MKLRIDCERYFKKGETLLQRLKNSWLEQTNYLNKKSGGNTEYNSDLTIKVAGRALKVAMRLR